MDKHFKDPRVQAAFAATFGADRHPKDTDEEHVKRCVRHWMRTITLDHENAAALVAATAAAKAAVQPLDLDGAVNTPA